MTTVTRPAANRAGTPRVPDWALPWASVLGVLALFEVLPRIGVLPSDYFRRQGFATFQDDPIGIENRKWVGIENLMWGDDYPHHEGTWPRSQEVIDRTMSDLTEEERRKVLGLNAAKLYGFEAPAA